ESDGGARNGRGTGAPVCDENVAVDEDRPLAEGLEVHGGAKRTPDEPLDLLGPAADLAALARGPLHRGPGEHGVLRRDPAGPGIASPIGHAFLNGGRAEHPGVSGGDETGPFGVGGDVSLEGHRAQLPWPALGPCDRNVHGRPSWILRTSPVVERPSRYGRMTTLPPAASTSSRPTTFSGRSEEHTSELQSRENLVCRLLLEKKKLKN